MRTKLLILVAVAVLLAVAAGLALWSGSGPRSPQPMIDPNDATAVRAGETLYATHCAACHGVPGVSPPVVQAISPEPPPAHDESGHTWQHPDFALFQLIRDGVAVANCEPVDPERMPMFRDVLTDRDLVAVLSYIKSTWPEDIRAEHDKVNVMYGPYNRAVGELIDGDAGG